MIYFQQAYIFFPKLDLSMPVKLEQCLATMQNCEKHYGNKTEIKIFILFNKLHDYYGV